MDGRRPRGSGRPLLCKDCNKAIRVASVLHGGIDIHRCPTCLEAHFNKKPQP